MLEASILDKKIRAAGIPIDGVSKENGSYRIDFRAEATPAQRTAAAAIVAAFDPAEAATKEAEIKQAPLTARAFFAASPAAAAFVRLTPAEQAAQIDGMALTQLKTVIKYLAVAVSALIKREYLNGG